MAQLHRHPGRSGHRPPQFRRPHRPHLRWPLHPDCHGRHGLRPRDLPLARAEYPAARPGRVRRSLRSDVAGGVATGGCGGELCAEDPGWWEVVIALIYLFVFGMASALDW